MDYFEQIEAYLMNTLSESEKIAFEEAMNSDPKLKQALEDHSIAMDVVGSILEDEVRKVIENAEGESENSGAVVLPIGEKVDERNGRVRRMNWMRWASAAVVVFVVGWWGVNQLTGIDDSELYSEVYNDPTWPTERGADETELSKAIVKYLTGNKDEAKKNLQLITGAESNYWLAEIYMKEMKYDSTLILLKKGIEIENNNKRDRINYLKILSLYFGGDKMKAKDAIEALPQDTDSFYQKIYSKLSF